MKRLFLMFLLAGNVGAAEMLTEMSSDVVQADGMTAEQVSTRAGECLKSINGEYADRVSVAVDGPRTYATVYTVYGSSDDKPADSAVRMRLSVLAKDGRFKVEADNITQYFGEMRFWSPIKKNSWSKNQQADIQRRIDAMAACVSPRKGEDPATAGW